ncbi:MAG: HlyD family efflux transporter periplasmic adaptor subunit [Scytonematopsis contorta HA4267-MV1]|jgi:hypothetical protein|nr:HlyD family efflux transporter periplasmic adaptor subunit [Scytonematopsis contorta HA4267-MV1]
MERIIRLNAVETSSHTPNHIRDQTQKSHTPNYKVVETALMSGSGNTVTSNFTEQSSEGKIQKAENQSIFLQKFLEEQPSAVPYLVILSSIAFFAIALVWACTGKIEEVAYLRLQFVPTKQVAKLHNQNNKTNKTLLSQSLTDNPNNGESALANDIDNSYSKVHPLDPKEVLQGKIKPLEGQGQKGRFAKKAIEPEIRQRIQLLAVSINSIRSRIAKTAKTNPIKSVPNDPLSSIVCSLNSCSVPLSTSFVLMATLPLDYAAFITEGDKLQIKLDAEHNVGKVPGRVVSITKERKKPENNAHFYQVAVVVENNYLTQGGQSIKLTAGQTGIAEITRKRRVADILLESFK